MIFGVVGFALPKLPGLGTLYGGLKDFTLAVVKERTKPETLPGLAAMMPESSLVAVLNRPGVTAHADLRVVQGDIEPSGLARRLAIWFADAFYRGDHDLVVDTSSMVGGLKRAGGAVTHFARGIEVDHFSYFLPTQPTAELVVDGLIFDTPSNFKHIEPPVSRGIVTVSRSDERAGQPNLFVLPGIAGSYLDVDDSRAWINVPWLAFGAIDKLGINRRNVKASGMVASFYGDLCEFFKRDHNVHPWAFDWRQSIEALGADLADDLEAAMDRSDEPLRILAHSMGGLVARQALSRASLHERFKSRQGCRLLMLGTPNGGSWAIPYLLTGNDSLGRNLASLDLTNDLKEILSVMSRFPGALQMLPHSDTDMFTTKFWRELHQMAGQSDIWPLPRKADLDAAKDFRDQFKRLPVLPDRMYYIAGQAPTVDGIDRSDKDRINFTRTGRGDGRVLWEDGIIEGLKTWYLPVSHGDLPRTEHAFDGMREFSSTDIPQG